MKIIALLIGMLAASQSLAHEAPKGWSYSTLCCSTTDCREVHPSAIGEGRLGYTIKRTGELLGFFDKRLRDSPDGEFHWCSEAGRDDTKTICLYIPPRGF